MPLASLGLACLLSAVPARIREVAGFYLNAFSLVPNGSVTLFEMRGALLEQRRDQLRDVVGVSVWADGRDALSYEEPRDFDAEERVVDLDPVTGLTQFVCREAIVHHARTLGFDAWVGRAGELQIVGLPNPAVEDRFRLEQGLALRVSPEKFIDAPVVLTARHRTLWRSAEPLTDEEVAAHAPGQSAVRLRGTGPRRGRVEQVEGEVATLLYRDETVEVAAADYALAVNAAMVARWRGSRVLQNLRVTAGEMTVTGRRNQHAVADRFKLAGDGVRRLGETIPVTGGGELTISSRPIQVRVEEAP
jgi:hypothetical protein